MVLDMSSLYYSNNLAIVKPSHVGSERLAVGRKKD